MKKHEFWSQIDFIQCEWMDWANKKKSWELKWKEIENRKEISIWMKRRKCWKTFIATLNIDDRQWASKLSRIAIDWMSFLTSEMIWIFFWETATRCYSVHWFRIEFNGFYIHVEWIESKCRGILRLNATEKEIISKTTKYHPNEIFAIFFSFFPSSQAGFSFEFSFSIYDDEFLFH